MATDQFTRFESKYVPVPFSGCWIWTASAVSKSSPYGRFQSFGRLELAHRASWMMHRGEIPNGMDVCHRCDVPACVNPDHLFLGTASDNIRDRMDKGRPHNVPSGANHCMAKLDHAAVEEIRSLRASGATQEALRKRFGVSKGTIYNVLNNLHWAGR